VYVLRLASPECFKVGLCRSTLLSRRLRELRPQKPTVVHRVTVANRAEATVVEYAVLELMHPWLLDLPFKSFGGRTEVWSLDAPEMDLRSMADVALARWHAGAVPEPPPRCD
jgi:hypothetical protein